MLHPDLFLNYGVTQMEPQKAKQLTSEEIMRL